MQYAKVTKVTHEVVPNVELRHIEITEIKMHHISVNIYVRAIIFGGCIHCMLSSLLVIFQLDPFA